MSSHQSELIAETPSPYQTERNAEREKYLALLAEKLKDPEFRAMEGFPIAEDEAILALSDPPYYTVCPNPFLPEIIERWQAEREQFGAENPEPQTRNPKPRTIIENPSPPTSPKAKTTPSTTPTPTTPKSPTKPLCATSCTTPIRAILSLMASAAPA